MTGSFHKLSFMTLLFCLSACAHVKQQDKPGTTQLLRDLKTLSSDEFEGRKTGSPGSKKAQELITARFEALGLQSFSGPGDYKQFFRFASRSGDSINATNIVGYIPGKIKECVVISAHYDHLGIRNNEIYNGADDNASGTAALLYFAQYYSKHKPNFTLIFAAFDAEELGLQGAKAFVDNPPIPLERIRLNMNMDMIAHNDKGELYICGTYPYPFLKKYVTSTNDKIDLKFGHDDPNTGHDDWTNQSDQGAFHAKNIPFLYFGVEDHKDYHQASDEFQNINETFYTNAANSILEVIQHLDSQYSSLVQIDRNKVMN